MPEKPDEPRVDAKAPRSFPAVSGVLPSGAVFETVHRVKDSRTAFVVWDHGEWRFESVLISSPTRHLVPYSPNNNLLRNGVVLFPSEPEEYRSEQDLIAEIQ